MKSVLFLGKKDDDYCASALAFLRDHFVVESYLGRWGESFPEDLTYWKGDYIISYLSRWVVPRTLIERAAAAAINFHPGSPEYPGIGCNNFALYEGATEYGITCHFMSPKVDTGEIIATKRFAIYPSDDVASLLARAYAYQLCLFYDVASLIIKGETIKASGEKWARTPFTRKEFNQLSKITPDMSAAEITRRVRATAFGLWRPSIEVGGRKFELSGPIQRTSLI